MATEQMQGTTLDAPVAEAQPARPRVVNDFSIQVATVNGSGSQSANNVLLRSIFRMGVPTSGKNLFPSNIAGLPTWYTIRASKYGYVARKKEIDIVVAMNPETQIEDARSLPADGVIVHPDTFNVSAIRTDVISYPIPFDKLTAQVCTEARLRKLVKNMLYVGVLGKLLNLDMTAVEAALRKQFARKQKAADLNWGAVQAGYDYAATSLTKQDPYFIERMHATDGKIIIDGNAATALGAMFAGVTVVTWYPITPSSSVVETLIDYLKKYRLSPEGKATFAVVQAEDELAAVGMVLGAGWAGARAMTATSGPGISLMAEFAGLGYYAEIPGVIVDVQRVGPSTGLPTRTAQGDVLSIAFLSHGDTKHVCLFPGSVKECYELTTEAFNLTERLQTPVFVLSDLDLGMNNWMSEPFAFPAKPLDRGKVMTAKEITAAGDFARYRDIDGDAITNRTLPGTDHPLAAYFTRGTGHNEKASYSERPDDYQNNLDRLARKWETARTMVPEPVAVQDHGTRIGILAYGSSDFAIMESRDQLLKEFGADVDYMRVRAYPFSHAVHDFIARHDRVYVVEQNRDAQMLSLLKLDLAPEHVTRLRSIRHYNGLPLDARSVTDALVLQEGI